MTVDLFYEKAGGGAEYQMLSPWFMRSTVICLARITLKIQACSRYPQRQTPCFEQNYPIFPLKLEMFLSHEYTHVWYQFEALIMNYLTR